MNSKPSPEHGGKTSRVRYASTVANLQLSFDKEALANIDTLRTWIDDQTGAKASTSLLVRFALRFAAARVGKEANG